MAKREKTIFSLSEDCSFVFHGRDYGFPASAPGILHDHRCQSRHSTSLGASQTKEKFVQSLRPVAERPSDEESPRANNILACIDDRPTRRPLEFFQWMAEMLVAARCAFAIFIGEVKDCDPSVDTFRVSSGHAADALFLAHQRFSGKPAGARIPVLVACRASHRWFRVRSKEVYLEPICPGDETGDEELAIVAREIRKFALKSIRPPEIGVLCTHARDCESELELFRKLAEKLSE